MLSTDVTRALDEVAATPRLLVTSDFDGTLAPIVDDPSAARALPAAAAALESLAELPDTTVALVSGRALEVLRELSAMAPTVRLVGSHGAEFDTGGRERSDSGMDTGGRERSDSGIDTGFVQEFDHALLARIVAELQTISVGKPGVTVETKPAGVALHVRNASADDAEAALEEARVAAATWDAHVTAGKAVLEFAVVTTDKGEAVDTLREQSDATAVVFLGDDVTDENAFRRMRDGDVGIKVGPGDTLAAHRIESPEDVAEVLSYLLAARR